MDFYHDNLDRVFRLALQAAVDVLVGAAAQVFYLSRRMLF